MYCPRLYKYRDSYVLYIPTVHTFGSAFLTHTLLVQTYTHDVAAPCYRRNMKKLWTLISFQAGKKILYLIGTR